MSIEIDPETPLPPRADLWSALVWIIFGAAVTAGSWRMDRLAHLNINQYEIPGLVPGLLGLAIFVLGMALALRAVARGALKSAGGAGSASNFSPGGTRTMPLVFALTLTYALVLVGRGMPFWLGTFAFVASFIFLFDRERQTAMQRSTAKQAALALLYGAATSAIVSYAFEKLFLVRLP